MGIGKGGDCGTGFFCSAYMGAVGIMNAPAMGIIELRDKTDIRERNITPAAKISITCFEAVG